MVDVKGDPSIKTKSWTSDRGGDCRFQGSSRFDEMGGELWRSVANLGLAWVALLCTHPFVRSDLLTLNRFRLVEDPKARPHGA